MTTIPKGRREGPRRPFRDAATAAAPALLLLAGLLLPFLGKAFTIDDTVFLRQAEWVLTDPLHPSALTMVWSEMPRPMRLSQVMPTGPLMAWILVPVALSGGSEVVGHLLQLGLVGVAVLFTAVLALRLGLGETVAGWAALLLASTPVVLGMAGTVMPDVAAMALAVVGIERLVAWRDGGRPVAGLLAALALGAAPLARSHALLLPGIALFLLGPPLSREALRAWMPVVAAPLVTLGVLFMTSDPEGASTDVASAAGFFSSTAFVRRNAVSFGVHHVLLLPIGLAWAAARGRRFVLSPLPWLATAGVAAALVQGGQRDWLWLAPVSGVGIAAVADLVREAVARRDRDFAALVAWMLLSLPVVVYLHFPAKYLLPSAPAAAIVAAAAIAAVPRRVATGLVGALVFAGSAFGVAILSADATFANLGRRAVQELIVPRVAAGERVWFNAHWGFQWYAEKAGARVLTATPPKPKPGDLVVSARETIAGILIEAFPRRELLATVTDTAPGGRLIDGNRGAGFWSNGWGYLPWVWGEGEVDRFELWRLR